MDNTNFQTIHQMGNAISNVVKQAMGRDTVQNIDMDFVTVAQRKKVIEETATGNPASFITNAIAPLKKLLCNVNPVQDLHGYEYPWVGGAGKNIFDASNVDDEHNYYVNRSNGQITTPSAGEWRATGYVPVTAGETYYIGKINGSGTSVGLAYYNSSKTYVSGISENGLTNANNIITIPSDCSYMRFSILIDEGYNTNWKNTVYVVKNSDTHEWTPYKNICPISGWTGANVTVSPTSNPDDPDKEVYSITFPSEAGTIYNGTLKVNKDGTGDLTVDKIGVVFDGTEDFGDNTTNVRFLYHDRTGKLYGSSHAEYNDNAINSIMPQRVTNSTTTSYAVGVAQKNTTQIRIAIRTAQIVNGQTVEDFKSFLASLYANGTPFIEVYKTETPIEYHFTAKQIRTLLGQNNIWSDTGNVTVTYISYVEVD